MASSLAAAAERADPHGCLFRIQHICFAGVNSACEGRIGDCWANPVCAVRVVQGLDANRVDDELECEMRRRVFCNPYTWNGLLSRQLERVPFLPDQLPPNRLPRMHLDPNDVQDVPEDFTE